MAFALKTEMWKFKLNLMIEIIIKVQAFNLCQRWKIISNQPREQPSELTRRHSKPTDKRFSAINSVFLRHW